MEYFGFLKKLIEQMLPNKLSKLGYIFIFLVFVFIPWTLNGGIFNEDVGLVSEESVPYFQTNTCDYSINSIVRDNFFNDKIEILPNVDSSVQCFGKINGVDIVNEKIKIYIGTNLNVDFLLQSLFFIFLMYLIPKTKTYIFKFSFFFPSLLTSVIVYFHLLGERLFYLPLSDGFDIGLNFQNFIIPSLLLVIFLNFYLINDLIKTRFLNLINFFPFIFLFNGSFNNLNLNFFVLLFSFIGINAIVQNKYNKKISLIYLTFSIIQIYNFETKNIVFDIDKLKGFVNSSQNYPSLIFWMIIFYLFIIGVVFTINESLEYIDLSLIKLNFLITGALILIFGVFSAINPFVNFYTYYFFGLNKTAMKSLSSTDGNTWRGLASSAEAAGEFFAFTVLFVVLLYFSKKIEINNFEIFLLILNLFGLLRSNNFASTISLIFFIVVYFILKSRLNFGLKIGVLFFGSILLFTVYSLSTFSYERASKALLQNAYKATEIGIELPGDELRNDAIDNLNFGEILSYPEDSTNISNSLYFLTKRYTYGPNISYLPNSVALVSAISLPINRSEKWGIFIAKYNPDPQSLLFGYGPQQITEYYLGHRTKYNSGLVLPHSSLLDYLIFFGLFGILLIIIYLVNSIWKNKNNYFYFCLISFLLINLIKSDSLLYSSSLLLFIFIFNFYKIDTEVHNSK